MADREHKPIPRSIAVRYFGYRDALIAAALFLVVGAIIAPILFVLGHNDLTESATATGLSGAVVTLLVATFLRYPSRSETRTAGQSTTGFTEVEIARRTMREGASLTLAQQEVAEDLDAACGRRLKSTTGGIVLTVVAAALVAGLLLLTRDKADTEALKTVIFPIAVIVWWLDWRRARIIRAELDRRPR